MDRICRAIDNLRTSESNVGEGQQAQGVNEIYIFVNICAPPSCIMFSVSASVCSSLFCPASG